MSDKDTPRTLIEAYLGTIKTQQTFRQLRKRKSLARTPIDEAVGKRVMTRSSTGLNSSLITPRTRIEYLTAGKKTEAPITRNKKRRSEVADTLAKPVKKKSFPSGFLPLANSTFDNQTPRTTIEEFLKGATERTPFFNPKSTVEVPKSPWPKSTDLSTQVLTGHLARPRYSEKKRHSLRSIASPTKKEAMLVTDSPSIPIKIPEIPDDRTLDFSPIHGISTPCQKQGLKSRQSRQPSVWEFTSRMNLSGKKTETKSPSLDTQHAATSTETEKDDVSDQEGKGGPRAEKEMQVKAKNGIALQEMDEEVPPSEYSDHGNNLPSDGDADREDVDGNTSGKSQYRFSDQMSTSRMSSRLSPQCPQIQQSAGTSSRNSLRVEKEPLQKSLNQSPEAERTSLPQKSPSRSLRTEKTSLAQLSVGRSLPTDRTSLLKRSSNGSLWTNNLSQSQTSPGRPLGADGRTSPTGTFSSGSHQMDRITLSQKSPSRTLLTDRTSLSPRSSSRLVQTDRTSVSQKSPSRSLRTDSTSLSPRSPSRTLLTDRTSLSQKSPSRTLRTDRTSLSQKSPSRTLLTDRTSLSPRSSSRLVQTDRTSVSQKSPSRSLRTDRTSVSQKSPSKTLRTDRTSLSPRSPSRTLLTDRTSLSQKSPSRTLRTDRTSLSQKSPSRSLRTDRASVSQKSPSRTLLTDRTSLSPRSPSRTLLTDRTSLSQKSPSRTLLTDRTSLSQKSPSRSLRTDRASVSQKSPSRTLLTDRTSLSPRSPSRTLLTDRTSLSQKSPSRTLLTDRTSLSPRSPSRTLRTDRTSLSQKSPSRTLRTDRTSLSQKSPSRTLRTDSTSLSPRSSSRLVQTDRMSLSQKSPSRTLRTDSTSLLPRSSSRLVQTKLFGKISTSTLREKKSFSENNTLQSSPKIQKGHAFKESVQKIPKQTRRRTPANPNSLPHSTVKQTFTHFCNLRVTKDAINEVCVASDYFFNNISRDLEAYARHATRKVIDETDCELLMKRHKFITEKQSLFSLAEKYLPLELRQEIIPIARSGNRIEGL